MQSTANTRSALLYISVFPVIAMKTSGICSRFILVCVILLLSPARNVAKSEKLDFGNYCGIMLNVLLAVFPRKKKCYVFFWSIVFLAEEFLGEVIETFFGEVVQDDVDDFIHQCPQAEKGLKVCLRLDSIKSSTFWCSILHFIASRRMHQQVQSGPAEVQAELQRHWCDAPTLPVSILPVYLIRIC